MSQRLTRLMSVPILPLIISFSLSTTSAQEAAKTLEWGDHANLRCGKAGEQSPNTYKIELEDMLMEGRSVLIGEPFVGDIRDLVFRVKNISEKPINFVQITVVLPEVERPPEIPFVSTSLEKRTNALLPGKEAELRIPDGKLRDWVKDTVTAQGMELQSVKRAAIDAVILFQDGQTIGACMKARDPRNQAPAK